MPPGADFPPVYITSDLSGTRTGGDLFVGMLAAHLESSGLDVRTGVDLHVPANAHRNPLLHTWWLRRAFGGIERGLVFCDHAHSTRLAPLMRHLSNRPEVRSLIVVHHIRETFRFRFPGYTRWGKRVEADCLRAAQRVTVHTREEARRVEALGVDPARLRRIPVGIRRVAVRHHPREIDDGAPLRLLWIGGDFQRKGLEVLLDALAMLPEPGAQLTVAGRPHTEREASLAVAGARERGLTDRVTFAGWVPDETLQELWSRHDVYVQPSLKEGHGSALDEALSCGMPVVATDLPVFRERLEESEVRFVPPRNADALARALEDVRSLQRRISLGEGAYRRAQELPDWNDTMAEYEALVREELRSLPATSR